MVIQKVTYPNGKQVLLIDNRYTFQRWSDGQPWEPIDPQTLIHTPITKDMRVIGRVF